MSNLITDAIGSISAGKSGTSGGNSTGGSAGASGDGGTSTDDSPYVDVEVVTDSSSVHAHDSVDESNEPETASKGSDTEKTPGDGSTAPAATKSTQTSKTPDPNKEVITITDDQGKRKLEIDYSDRAAIRKAHELAALARKTQAERDRERTERTALTEKYTSVNRVVEALEKAFSEKGELGVIDLIAGKPGASADFVRKQVERAKFLEKASPEDVQRLEEKERLEYVERELVKQRRENEDREKRIVEERETAELRSTEATVHPVFEKYRFDGKLGSEDDEAMFDEMLWNTALKRLKPFEDQGVAMTKELVEREFRTVASSLRKRINVQAEKRAAAVVNQKKQEATENAQASTVGAYKRGGATAEANDMLNKGDFAGFFRSFGKSAGKRK